MISPWSPAVLLELGAWLEQVLHADTAQASLPRRLEGELCAVIAALAQSVRTHTARTSHDVFLSYSHRDMERARVLLDIVEAAGVRVFHDVRDIPVGASIVATLHGVMAHVRRAILLLSEHYVRSVWAHRELQRILERQRDGSLTLLPVLVDDVPLPDAIRDIFTIDLRGFRCADDRPWAEQRLGKLIDACVRGA